MPLLAVEDGGEGIGEDVVVVDEFAIRTAGAVGDTPTEGLGRTGEDLADAVAVLYANFVRGIGIIETPGFDDGKELPADLGFFLGGEFDRDDTGGEGTVEQRPEPFADTGGIDDDVLGRPLGCQILDLTEDRQVILPGPGVTGKDAVGRVTELGEGGEVESRRW